MHVCMCYVHMCVSANVSLCTYTFAGVSECVKHLCMYLHMYMWDVWICVHIWARWVSMSHMGICLYKRQYISLFNFTLRYSAPCSDTVHSFSILSSPLLYSPLLHPTVLYFTVLYSTQRYSIMLESTRSYLGVFYRTPLASIIFY